MSSRRMNENSSTPYVAPSQTLLTDEIIKTKERARKLAVILHDYPYP
jgi:hypothetical protein